MKATVALTALLSSLALAGCVQHQAPRALPGPVMTIAEAKNWAVEQRKKEMLQDLATCESGGHGESERMIVGGRGAYHGRFQFMPRTIITFVQQMDGRTLSLTEAKELAHDYERAAELAKFVIFEKDGIGNWPLCARKLGLRTTVADIKSQE
jgi:hypothetical protein